MSTQSKPKLAFYWAASCGGCEITITELGMKLMFVNEKVEIVFWPCLMDFKYSDVEALQDDEIDITFFNGAIRSSENEHIAKLLRQKSKLLVAFGSCSHTGGIPGLANFYDAESILDRVFNTAPSLDESRGTRPVTSFDVPEGTIELPDFYDQVKTLKQTVEVDYYMPGCPPVVDQVWNVFQTILAGELPEKGATIGVGSNTNCDVCSRVKGEGGFKVKEWKRPHEVDLDPELCFLAQGVICYGPATRAGCGLPCISGNMPCRGCYGPPEGVVDQGAKLLSAIGALIDTSEPSEIQHIMDTIVDPAGLSYRFGLADSVMNTIRFKKSDT
jgi:F420-non-reducing hydrogenase small subunit